MAERRGRRAGRRDLDWLEDMRLNAALASEWAGADEGRFYADAKHRYAIERALELVGEAASNLSRELRGRYPEVAWRGAIGQRGVIVHEYFGLELERIWRTLTEDLPRLRAQLERIIPRELSREREPDDPGMEPEGPGIDL